MTKWKRLPMSCERLEINPLFARPGEEAVEKYSLNEGEMLSDTAYQIVHDEAMLRRGILLGSVGGCMISAYVMPGRVFNMCSEWYARRESTLVLTAALASRIRRQTSPGHRMFFHHCRR